MSDSAQEIERLTTAMRDIADMARREASAGAPAGMVAVYVAAEIRHAIANHEGRGVDCNECIYQGNREVRDRTGTV